MRNLAGDDRCERNTRFRRWKDPSTGSLAVRRPDHQTPPRSSRSESPHLLRRIGETPAPGRLGPRSLEFPAPRGTRDAAQASSPSCLRRWRPRGLRQDGGERSVQRRLMLEAPGHHARSSVHSITPARNHALPATETAWERPLRGVTQYRLGSHHNHRWRQRVTPCPKPSTHQSELCQHG